MLLLHISFGTLSVIASVIALFVVFKNMHSYYKKLALISGVFATSSIFTGIVMLIQNIHSPDLLPTCAKLGVYVLLIGLVEGLLINKLSGIPVRSLVPQRTNNNQ